MRTRWFAAGLVLLVALGACATKEELVSSKEDMLAAAGFDTVPANTKERRNDMALLPPNKISIRNENGKLVYLYPDPIVCGCLYIGTQQNYGKYKEMMFQKQLADQQQMTAMEWQDARWSWGPWGPGWW